MLSSFKKVQKRLNVSSVSDFVRDLALYLKVESLLGVAAEIKLRLWVNDVLSFILDDRNLFGLFDGLIEILKVW